MKKRLLKTGILIMAIIIASGMVTTFAYNDDIEDNLGRYYAFNQFFLDHFAGCANGDVAYLSAYPCPPGNTTTPLASSAPTDRMLYISDNNWIPIAAYSPAKNIMNFYFAGEQDLNYSATDIIQLDKACADKHLADFVSGHSVSDIKAISDMAQAAQSFNFYLYYLPEYTLPGVSGVQAEAGRVVSSVYTHFGDYINLFESDKINITVADGATLKLTAPFKINTLTFNAGSTWDLSTFEISELSKFGSIKKITCDGSTIVLPESITDAQQEEFLKFVEDTGGIKIVKGNDVSEPLGTASEWARAEILSAISKGFVPKDIQDDYQNVITRLEFCRMAVKFAEYATGKEIDAILADHNVSRNPSAFADTDSAEILAAYALGITDGTRAPTDDAPGLFSPEGEITRQQAARMLMNVCKALGVNVDGAPPSGYADIGSAASWAVDAINFCFTNNIMQGTGNNMFSPTLTYNRQQSIVTFDRIKLS